MFKEVVGCHAARDGDADALAEPQIGHRKTGDPLHLAMAQGQRLDVSGIDYGSSFEEVIKKVEELNYSRLPVYNNNLDELKGMLHTKDLLPHVNAWLRPRLVADVRPGARIVSHAFPMEPWDPVATRRVGNVLLYLWVAGS